MSHLVVNELSNFEGGHQQIGCPVRWIGRTDGGGSALLCLLRLGLLWGWQRPWVWLLGLVLDGSLVRTSRRRWLLGTLCVHQEFLFLFFLTAWRECDWSRFKKLKLTHVVFQSWHVKFQWVSSVVQLHHPASDTRMHDVTSWMKLALGFTGNQQGGARICCNEKRLQEPAFFCARILAHRFSIPLLTFSE